MNKRRALQRLPGTLVGKQMRRQLPQFAVDGGQKFVRCVAIAAFDSFQKLIGKQTAKILGGKDDRTVQFRLETKGGKVALKAKVVK